MTDQRFYLDITDLVENIYSAVLDDFSAADSPGQEVYKGLKSDFRTDFEINGRDIIYNFLITQHYEPGSERACFWDNQGGSTSRFWRHIDKYLKDKDKENKQNGS